jgi:hypothetical protein
VVRVAADGIGQPVEDRAEGCLGTAGQAPFSRGCGVQLPITSDHFFVFLSILTSFAPDLSESHGQNRYEDGWSG